MYCNLVFFLAGLLVCNGQQEKMYRYDYEYNPQANGFLKFHQVPGTWREARMRCHAEGAVLASPLTHQLKSGIITFVARHKKSMPTTIFTGVHATFSKGDYASIEGVHLPRLPITWAPGEPDNFENSESCLAMVSDGNGSMSDVKCSEVLPYVCYKKDTHMTLTACGTTDPEYTLYAQTGHCYKFHKRGLTWSQAYMTCMAEGGHLVIINSETEAEVVQDIYSKYPDPAIRSTDPGISAIGYHDWGERATWLTIHGETLDEAGFQRWAQNQPDNSTRARTGDTGEYCGGMFREANLNDLGCNVAVPFICEKTRDSLLKDCGGGGQVFAWKCSDHTILYFSIITFGFNT